jgi:cytochrome b6-f complex iron-sulfur subunit
MTPENINRRDFIGKTFKTITIGALTLSAIDLTKILANTIEINSGEKPEEKVIKISDFPDLSSAGGYTMITKKVIVIRLTSSKFLALNITCRHKQCAVDFDGSSFECPCHGSEYDKYGKVTHGPSTKNLVSYKTSFDESSDELTIFI